MSFGYAVDVMIKTVGSNHTFQSRSGQFYQQINYFKLFICRYAKDRVPWMINAYQFCYCFCCILKLEKTVNVKTEFDIRATNGDVTYKLFSLGSYKKLQMFYSINYARVLYSYGVKMSPIIYTDPTMTEHMPITMQGNYPHM